MFQNSCCEPELRKKIFPKKIRQIGGFLEFIFDFKKGP